MKRLNINTTEEFEKDLEEVMKHYGIKKKTAAIRKVFRELAAKIRAEESDFSFREALGAGLKTGINCNPRFKSEDDLWT